MEPPSFPPTVGVPAQQAPTVAGPPSGIFAPPAPPQQPGQPYAVYGQRGLYGMPPLTPSNTPTMPPMRPNRPVALGVTIIFVAALVVIGVVTSSLSSALAQARVIAYPQPRIQIVFAQDGQTPHVGDQLQFSLDVLAGHDLNVSWDFGDGGSATGQSVMYDYTQFGSYVIQATATDPLGQSASASYPITVQTRPPQASFAATVDPSNPLDYNFDASASTGDTSLTYNWDFGDGATEPGDSGPTTSHAYSKPGTYTVTLTVSDQDGQSSRPFTATVTITIPRPVASFSWSNDSSCFGTNGVYLDGSASSAYGGVNTWSWNYGDGNTDYGPYPYHQFPYTSYWNVTLTITDQYGQSASDTQTVYAC